MNDVDPLESELAALSPRPVSAGLRDRIAASLDPPAPSNGRQARPGSRRIGWLVLTACAAAACLFVFLRWPFWPALPEGKNTAPNVVQQASAKENANNASAASQWKAPDPNLPAFSWPLYETPPMKGYASIPPDLLD
jgi:hypothetical protein